MTPPITAIVAGTAPPARTWLSSDRAVSRFWGYGIPWVMMVLSSATTGRPPCNALRISGATFRYIPYHHDRTPWSLRHCIRSRGGENAQETQSPCHDGVVVEWEGKPGRGEESPRCARTDQAEPYPTYNPSVDCRSHPHCRIARQWPLL